MTRKLLPYEHDLITALGVTKEEYLEFLAAQEQYTDIKEGSVLDIRNDPGTIVAIVLAVVGVVFQVVSALLTPRPNIPSISAGPGQRQTREQRFSPRFGFNSTQELAQYGDTVPLVYTNRNTVGNDGNPNGGVRIAGSLVWSAVRSYGSNQFLQMLMVLAGGAITAIDRAKCAFGQTPLTSLIAQNYWLYFDDNGTGALQFSDETTGSSATDPTRYGEVSQNPYRIQRTPDNTRVDGFSQAYSPSTSAVFGGYSPVPLNVKTYLRDESGTKSSTALGISVSGSVWSKALRNISVGETMTVTIASTANPPTGVEFEDDLIRSAMDARRNFASVFDDAGIFKLGSARFRVTNVSGTSTDEGNVVISLQCIEAGRAPSIPYGYTEINDTLNIYKTDPKYIEAKKIVDNLLSIDGRNDLSFTSSSSLERLGSAGQAFTVTTAEDLLRSGQLWRIYPVVFTADYKFIRNITEAEKEAIETFISLREGVLKGSDDIYYLKALVRIEEALYNTVSACNIVDIAIKCQLFRRISGRQQVYGSKQLEGYATSDNGITNRTALFIMRYRIAGDNWSYVPGIFAVRRAADQDNFIYIKFNGGTTPQNWQFQLEPVTDPVAEVTERADLRLSDGFVPYYYMQNSGSTSTISLGSGRSIYFTGFTRRSSTALPPINQSPVDTNEWDWFNLDADTQVSTSFERGPEFGITAVSEQQTETFSALLYQNLALIGFNIFSGKSLQDMRSFTAFVTAGRRVRRLNTTTLTYPAKPDGPTCFAPDIFLDTILDSTDGIGTYAELEGIDTQQLAITKRFCRTNQLFMDGIIADRQNWREFWTQVAPFSLLEFARIGGRETLIPAVPYNPATGRMDRRVNISALFNQGNILEDSYKEEYLDYDANVQDIIATIIYRGLDSNGVFAVNRSVSVQRRDVVENDCIRQTFDISAFVTNEYQAILFGKLLCNLRRYIRTAVEFKTYPTTSPISPGAYIYVDMGYNAWDGIRTGTIGAGGKLNIPLDNAVPNGRYSVLLYRSGNNVISTTATITNNTAATLAVREGWLFVLGTQVRRKRVFRVADVQMDEEGQVTVRATIFPCDTSDNALISDFTDSLFTIRR